MSAWMICWATPMSVAIGTTLGRGQWEGGANTKIEMRVGEAGVAYVY